MPNACRCLVLAVPRSLLVRCNRFIDQARVLVCTEVFRVKISLNFQVPPELLVARLQLARVGVQYVADNFAVSLVLVLVLALSPVLFAVCVTTLLSQSAASPIFLNRSHLYATLRTRIKLGDYLALVHW